MFYVAGYFKFTGGHFCINCVMNASLYANPVVACDDLPFLFKHYFFFQFNMITIFIC